MNYQATDLSARMGVATSEPTVLGAIWRNRWMVAVGAGGGLLLALGFFLTGGNAPDYVAAATVEVIDPSRSSLLADSSGQTSDRFVANQLLIFRSGGVASRAAELAVDSSGTPIFEPSEMVANSTILSQPGTDIITIVFSAGNEEAAVAGANAVATAYREIKAETIEQRAAATLDRIDGALSSVDTEIQNIDEQIGTYNPNLLQVGERIELLVSRLLTVQSESDAVDGAASEAASDQLQALTSELQSLQLVQNIYGSDQGLTSLLQEQDRLRDWSLQLTTRRFELEIDQQQAASGVGTLSHASSASAETPNATRLLTIGLFMGAVAGSGVAFLMAHSRRVLGDSMAPEPILNAPFLGEVPDFAADNVESLLPVRDAPRSASAESFRFVATSLEAQMQDIAGERVAVVSGEIGDGKSVVIANTALSAAYGGRRVLVIDADFGNQSLGALFGMAPRMLGLTDVVANRARLADAVASVRAPGNPTISYLGRGTMPTTAPDFFGRRECQEFFEILKGQFDLVLVDTPPLLQVAYGATVARLCDAVLAVVKHGARESQLFELNQRLNLVGVSTLGYVYNRAPLRDFMTRSDGSMKDVVGDSGYLVPTLKGRA